MGQLSSVTGFTLSKENAVAGATQEQPRVSFRQLGLEPVGFLKVVGNFFFSSENIIFFFQQVLGCSQGRGNVVCIMLIIFSLKIRREKDFMPVLTKHLMFKD